MPILHETGGWTVSNVDSFYTKEKGCLGLISAETTDTDSYIIITEPHINDPSKNLHYHINQDNLTVSIHFLGLLEYCKTTLYVLALLAEITDQTDDGLISIKTYNYTAIIDAEFVILTIPFTQDQFYIESRIDYYNETYQVLKISKDIANFLALKLIRECTKYPIFRKKAFNAQ